MLNPVQHILWQASSVEAARLQGDDKRPRRSTKLFTYWPLGKRISRIDDSFLAKLKLNTTHASSSTLSELSGDEVCDCIACNLRRHQAFCFPFLTFSSSDSASWSCSFKIDTLCSTSSTVPRTRVG